MIDFTTETVLTFTEAAQHLPSRRGGRKPHAATIARWSGNGLRGVVLETIRVGGTRCTSLEALQRFFDRLTALDGAKSRRAKPSSRHQNLVEKELDRAGIG